MRAVPTARILHSIRSRDWTVHEALAELVDNSFGELRGNATSVVIQWTPATRELFVYDNGQGMKDVIDLFTLGKGVGQGRGDIGLFGVGGSEALLWLSDRVFVQTLRDDGMESHGKANWDECVRNEEFPYIYAKWREASAMNCAAVLLNRGHGTLINLHVPSGIRIQPDFLQERLSRKFGVGLRNGRQIQWVTIERQDKVITTNLQEWNPGPMTEVIEGTVVLKNGLSANVKAGLVEGLSIRDSKLSVNCIYRQIKETTAGFGRPIQGATGYIDLSPEWVSYLTTTKDNIREDSRELEEELMSAVSDVLKPLVDQIHQAKRVKIFENIRIALTRKFTRGFEELVNGHEESPEPHPRTGESAKGSGTPGKRREKRATEITIEKCSNAVMRELLCKVEIGDHKIVAFINEEHELVVTALDTEPVNQRLLETLLVSALATEIIEADALVKFGIVTNDGMEKLKQKYPSTSDLLLYLQRVLTDRIVHAV